MKPQEFRDLRGVVYVDRDSDGRRGPREEPVPGAIVTLRLPDGRIVTATTDADGVYTLPRVPFGEHPVTVTHNGQALLSKKTIVVADTNEGDLDLPTHVEGVNLALTGSNSTQHGDLALMMVLVGFVLVLATRRRKRHPTGHRKPVSWRCRWR